MHVDRTNERITTDASQIDGICKKKKVKGSQQTNKKSRGVGITDIPPPLPNLTRGGVSKLSQDATPGGCGTRSPVTEPAATSQAGSSYLGAEDSSLSQSPYCCGRKGICVLLRCW